MAVGVLMGSAEGGRGGGKGRGGRQLELQKGVNTYTTPGLADVPDPTACLAVGMLSRGESTRYDRMFQLPVGAVGHMEYKPFGTISQAS